MGNIKKNNENEKGYKIMDDRRNNILEKMIEKENLG